MLIIQIYHEKLCKSVVSVIQYAYTVFLTDACHIFIVKSALLGGHVALSYTGTVTLQTKRGCPTLLLIWNKGN